MHRLNSAEYNATVQDVLGTTLQPASGSWRGGELAGFDNIASVLGVDEAQYDRYLSAAQALATELLASDKLRARFVPCELSDSACAGPVSRRLGYACFGVRSNPTSYKPISTYTTQRARWVTTSPPP